MAAPRRGHGQPVVGEQRRSDWECHVLVDIRVILQFLRVAADEALQKTAQDKMLSALPTESKDVSYSQAAE